MNNGFNLWETFKSGNKTIRLIYINCFVFAGLNIISILLRLFNIDDTGLWHIFAAPSQLTQISKEPWSLVTYMFTHQSFFHILFNMMSLYWFGQLFTVYFSEKQLVGLYLLGGLTGGLFYIAAFNIFPYYAPVVNQSMLLGASGSIMAVIVATAIQAPNVQTRLLFIGNVPLKYIAMVAVGTSFFGITGENGGGQLAHLGGALTGWLFIVSLRARLDITRWINLILDWAVTLFSKRQLKVRQGKRKSQKMNDGDYNIYKAQKMADIDKILDKIKTSGYESLSADEKKRLFDQSKTMN